MECIDSSYHCLCAYLLDGDLDPEETKLIEADPELCPRCRNCDRRELELRLQRDTRSRIQRYAAGISMPDSVGARVKHVLEIAEEYREFGTQVLDAIPWGTHIAQFYNARNEVTEVLVPYIEKGLRQDELCVWIVKEMSEAEAKDNLAKKVHNLRDYISKGQLQLFSYKDWYLPEGNFDTQKALSRAMAKCQEATSSDYSGLRITGNVSWLEPSDWDSFMEYEGLLNDAAPEQKALLLCVYKEAMCTKAKIADVMDRHKYVISKMDDSWRVRRAA